MAGAENWSDEYWPLLMQLYLKKPEGVKPVFGRGTVDLAMELHVHPQLLHEKMKALRKQAEIDREQIIPGLEEQAEMIHNQQSKPSLKKLWRLYGDNPKKLKKDTALIRQMQGFYSAGAFYDGVEIKETFEKIFRPIPDIEDNITPLMLILILDLYFRLTPITMQEETPEVRELAKLISMKPAKVAEILEVFQYCDPYLKREAIMLNPLSEACQKIWQKYANIDTMELVNIAAEYSEYYKS